MKRFSLLVAKDSEGGIGRNNELPWRCRKEYRHFVATSSRLKDGKKAAAIVGRNTWESIPEKFRPLKNRHNYVISSTIDVANPGSVPVFKTLSQCMKKIDDDDEVGDVWICGGFGMYQEAMKSDRLHRMYITMIQGKFDCEVFFPSFVEEDFNLVIDPDVPQGTVTEENGISWSVSVFERKK
ncbi:dihydrofolate reductase-like [Bolinopsis microptera]|uniref:dihydrofolate reductase-like n=1 Tax=Bolinopsis microptera TaxID=2820187 RepID=UPI003079A0D1